MNFSPLGIERFVVPARELRQVPLYDLLHNHICNPLDLGDVDGFVIWGGFAANLLLLSLGRTNQHFSVHDVELMATNGEYIACGDLYTASIENAFAARLGTSIKVGGRSIARNMSGMTVTAFQEQRIDLDDGDLLLNNVVVHARRALEQVAFIAPAGTLENLRAERTTIQSKCSRDLSSAHRLSRRICRNISKATRFSRAGGGVIEDAQIEEAKLLLNRFCEVLIRTLQSRAADDEDAAWAAHRSIATMADGVRWLLRQVVSETAMRLQPLAPEMSASTGHYGDLLFGPTGVVNEPIIAQLIAAANQVDWVKQALRTSTMLSQLTSEGLAYCSPAQCAMAARLALPTSATFSTPRIQEY